VDVLYLFGFIFQSGILGALMTFTSRPWYPLYESTTSLWGLTPLEDQQLAGLIMWIPGGLIYAASALALLAACLQSSERQAQRRESASSVG
jgi:putative membrane protein